MKKLVGIALALALCISASACGQKAIEGNPDVPFDAVYDSVTDTTIRLGATRGEIDTVYGAPFENPGLSAVAYLYDRSTIQQTVDAGQAVTGSLSVTYTDRVVTAIAVKKDARFEMKDFSFDASKAALENDEQYSVLIENGPVVIYVRYYAQDGSPSTAADAHVFVTVTYSDGVWMAYSVGLAQQRPAGASGEEGMLRG